jgi:hypothetical protein
MSEAFMPASLSAFSAEYEGPVSMMVGSLPIEAKARMRARGLRPRRWPTSALPISTAEAPSTMPDELPAWCTWVMRSSVG